MAAIILEVYETPDGDINIVSLSFDEYGINRIFEDEDAANVWLEDNHRIGPSYHIVEI